MTEPADSLAKVHARAMTAFRRTQDSLRDERRQCLQDRRFYSVPGAQWEGDLAQQYENLPKFEANKIHLAVIRIFNEYRNNRISVQFRPASDESEDLSETLNGLYRADEQDSGAQEAYDNSFEEGVGGGIGAWRLRAVYEDESDEDDDRQRIAFEPIYDADSCVFFDVDAKRQDKSDAKCCFVLVGKSREGYIEEYGEDPGTWPKEVRQDWFDWCVGDIVYVAEYYEIEEKRETIHFYVGLDGKELKVPEAELEQKRPTLLATGFRKSRSKKVKRPKVHKYIVGATKVLEDCGLIAGRHIPIVPSYGKRWVVDGVERCMGHVRLAKDAQRLKNMQLSKLGQISSTTSIEKPIFTPEQINGHQVMWSEDNIKQYPYLLVNPVENADGTAVPAGPVGYTKPPAIPPALAALLQITEQDMQDLLGNQQAGEKMLSNIGEKTVEMIQNRLDMQTFIYVDNMAKAVKRCGEVWLSMAQELYADEGRKMETVSEHGETGTIELMRPMIDKETAEQYYENNIAAAKMKVVVDVGPSFTTRRQSTVNTVTGLMGVTQDPQDLSVLSAMAIMNMDGEGLKDLRPYYRRKLIGLGALKPTEEEAKEMAEAQANQRPDPQAELAQSLAAEAQANAQKAQAGTVLALANAEKSKADTVKILAETDGTKVDNVIKQVNAITGAGTNA